MTNIYAIALLIAFSFLFFKFIEMRFIIKENIPLKLLIRDAIIVYISVLLTDFFVRQFTPIITSAHRGNKHAPAFTDDPSF